MLLLNSIEIHFLMFQEALFKSCASARCRQYYFTEFQSPRTGSGWVNSDPLVNLASSVHPHTSLFSKACKFDFERRIKSSFFELEAASREIVFGLLRKIFITVLRNMGILWMRRAVARCATVHWFEWFAEYCFASQSWEVCAKRNWGKLPLIIHLWTSQVISSN